MRDGLDWLKPFDLILLLYYDMLKSSVFSCCKTGKEEGRIKNEIVEKVLKDEKLDLEDIIKLLELRADSEEVRIIGNKARDIARTKAGNIGKIWAAIGLDYVNCKMNCSFCSLGDKWNAIGEQTELQDDAVMRILKRQRDFWKQAWVWYTMQCVLERVWIPVLIRKTEEGCLKISKHQDLCSHNIWNLSVRSIQTKR